MLVIKYNKTMCNLIKIKIKTIYRSIKLCDVNFFKRLLKLLNRLVSCLNASGNAFHI